MHKIEIKDAVGNVLVGAEFRSAVALQDWLAGLLWAFITPEIERLSALNAAQNESLWTVEEQVRDRDRQLAELRARYPQHAFSNLQEEVEGLTTAIASGVGREEITARLSEVSRLVGDLSDSDGARPTVEPTAAKPLFSGEEIGNA